MSDDVGIRCIFVSWLCNLCRVMIVYELKLEFWQGALSFHILKRARQASAKASSYVVEPKEGQPAQQKEPCAHCNCEIQEHQSW